MVQNNFIKSQAQNGKLNQKLIFLGFLVFFSSFQIFHCQEVITATIVPTNDYTYQQTNLQITFSVPIDIESVYELWIVLPQFWKDYPLSFGNVYWNQDQGLLKATEVTTNNALDGGESTSDTTIKIGLNSIPSGTTTTIIVESFINPLVTQYSTNTISLKISSNTGYPYAESTINYLISQPFFLQADKVRFVQNSFIVQENTSLSIELEFQLPVRKEIYMVITFPSNIDISSTTSVSSGSFLATATTTKNDSLKTLTITNIISSNNSPISNMIGKFTISNVRLQNYQSTSNSIKVLCKYGTSGEIFQVVSGISLTANYGSVVSVDVAPNDMGVGVTTDYVFTIGLKHKLDTNGQIKIEFPSQINVSGVSGCSSSVAAFSGLSCTVSGQIVTISSMFTSYTFTGSDTIIFTVKNVKNPLTTSQTGVLKITTYYTSTVSTSIVDYDESATITAEPVSIPSVTVTPSSYEVGDSNLSYTFTFVNQIDIPTNGYILVTFQSDFIQTPASSLSCQVKANSSTIGNTCSVSQSSPFQVKVIVTSSIATSASVDIIIQNCVTNPGIVKSYSTFQIYAYTSTNFALQSKTSGISVSITEPTNFMSEPNFSLGSYVNSVTTDVTFLFTFSLEHKDDYSLVIKFPQNYDGISYFGTTTTCTVSSTTPLLKSSLPCVKSGDTLTITLGFQTSSSTFQKGDSASITVQNINNFYSTQPSLTSFEFNTYATTTSQKIQYQLGTQKLQTTTTNVVTYNSKSAINTVFSSVTTYTISFTTFSQIPSNGKIHVTFPSVFSIDSSTSVTSPQISGITRTVVGNVVQISGTSFTSKTISISFTLITNPSHAQYQTLSSTDTFKISTFDQSDAKIDFINTDATFTLNCDFDTYHCKTCNNGDSTKCLSCYDNSITTYQYYNSYDNTCVDSCPSGFFLSGTQCEICTDNCATCSGTSNFCLTCKTDYLFYANTCISACSSTQYKQGNQCYDCDTSIHCKGCLNAVECTSCQNTYYLYGTICTQDCEAESSNYAVLYNGQCAGCTSPCDKCTTSRSTCLSCDFGYYLYGNSCLTKCPAGYGIDGLNCELCEPTLNCKTCYSDNTICESCKSGFFFNYNTSECLVTCPNGYFEDASNNQCTKCDDICLTCDTNAQDCIDCSDSAIVFNGNCYQECPDAYPHYADGTCKSHSQFCNQTCSTCQDKDICLTCKSGLFLLNGGCYEECPDGYEVDDSYSTCEPQGEENFEEHQFFPTPLTILSVFFMLSIFISKKAHSFTHVRASLVGIISIFEFSSWAALFYAYYNSRDGNEASDFTSSKTMAVIVVGVVASYAVNIFFAIAFCCHYATDPKFKKWKKESYGHGLIVKILQVCGLIFTFKMYRILYCRYFDYSFFNMKLESISKFVMTNVFSVISIFVSSVPIIVGSCSIIYYYQKVDQTLMQAIDALILTLLMIVFLLFDAKKDKEFFDDPKNELNQSLSKTYYNQSQLPLNRSQLSEFEQLQHYKHGVGTHQRRQAEDLDISEFNQANQVQETENMEKPFSKHTIPGKSETINQAQLSSNMQYQEQNEQSLPGKERAFTTIRKNPYKGYMVLKPISEMDEINNNSEMNSKDRQAIFMEGDEYNNQDEQFYNQVEEISFYDDDYEPEFPTRMVKNNESLVCHRPGLKEMSRGFLAQKGFNNDDDDESINDDEIHVLEEEGFDEEFEDSRESDYELDKPVQFAQVISNNIKAKRQLYQQQQQNQTAIYNNSMNNISMSDSQLNTIQALKENDINVDGKKRGQIEVRQSTIKNADIENQKGEGDKINQFRIDDNEKISGDTISFENNYSDQEKNDEEKQAIQTPALEQQLQQNALIPKNKRKQSRVFPVAINNNAINNDSQKQQNQDKQNAKSRSKSKPKSKSPNKNESLQQQKQQNQPKSPLRKQVSPNKNQSAVKKSQNSSQNPKKNNSSNLKNSNIENARKNQTLNNDLKKSQSKSRSPIRNDNEISQKDLKNSQNSKLTGNSSQKMDKSKNKYKNKSKGKNFDLNQDKDKIKNKHDKSINNNNSQISTNQQQQQQQQLNYQRSSSNNQNGLIANLSSISGIPFANNNNNINNQKTLEKTIDYQSPIQHAAQIDDSYIALNPMDLNQEHIRILNQNLENQSKSQLQQQQQKQQQQEQEQSNQSQLDGDNKQRKNSEISNIDQKSQSNQQNTSSNMDKSGNQKKGNYKKRKNNGQYQIGTNPSGQFDTPQFIKNNQQQSQNSDIQFENTQSNINDVQQQLLQQQQRERQNGVGEFQDEEQKDDKFNQSENQIAQDILHEIDPKNYKKPRRYEDKYKQKLLNQKQNDQENKKPNLKNIIDPDDNSVNSMMRESKELNDVSPSDFNFLNMRYDETFLNETNQQGDDIGSQNSQMIPKSMLNRNTLNYQNSLLGRSNKFSDLGNPQSQKFNPQQINQTIGQVNQINSRPPLNRARSNTQQKKYPERSHASHSQKPKNQQSTIQINNKKSSNNININQSNNNINRNQYTKNYLNSSNLNNSNLNINNNLNSSNLNLKNTKFKKQNSAMEFSLDSKDYKKKMFKMPKQKMNAQNDSLLKEIEKNEKSFIKAQESERLTMQNQKKIKNLEKIYLQSNLDSKRNVRSKSQLGKFQKSQTNVAKIPINSSDIAFIGDDEYDNDDDYGYDDDYDSQN